MNTKELKFFLKKIRDGKIDIETGINKLRNLSYIDLGCAKLDTHRELRVGYPEVIFCQGKTKEQVKTIIQAMIKGNANILVHSCRRGIFCRR